MISARVPAGAPVLLLAPVRGLLEEARQAVAVLEPYAPEVVGLGLSAEELTGITDYFVRSEAEPVVSLTGPEAGEVRGLVRFGEVRVPNPTFVEVVRWGHAHSVPVEALDPSDERSASLFAEHIGYVELVRRTVRERRAGRRPPSGSTPDEFALAWDREVAPGRGSAAFARARDRHLARGALGLRARSARVALVVDRERFAAVRDLLEHGVPNAMGDE